MPDKLLCAHCSRHAVGLQRIEPAYPKFDEEQKIYRYCSIKCREAGVTDFTRSEERSIDKIVEETGKYFQTLDKWNLEDWSYEEASGLVKLIIGLWFELAPDDEHPDIPSKQ